MTSIGMKDKGIVVAKEGIPLRKFRLKRPPSAE
jgi:hypothetical protein